MNKTWDKKGEKGQMILTENSEQMRKEKDKRQKKSSMGLQKKEEKGCSLQMITSFSFL